MEIILWLLVSRWRRKHCYSVVPSGIFWNTICLVSVSCDPGILFQSCVTNSSPNEIMEDVRSSVLFYKETRDKDMSH